MLDFALCDLNGSRVADLRDRLPGSSVVPGFNSELGAWKVAVGVDDPDVRQAVPLVRVAKAWLDGEIVFCGPLGKPRYDSTTRTVEMSAISTGYRLETAFVNNRSDTDFSTGVGVFPGLTQTDALEIMAQLMEHGLPTVDEVFNQGVIPHGIIRGDLPASILVDRAYDTGAQILAQFTELSELEGGPDFDFTPLDRTDGVLAQLDGFWPRRGSDLSQEVVFEVGMGLDNAAALVWEPDGLAVRNRHTSMGQSIAGQLPALYRANSLASQQLMGKYEAFVARTDLVYSTSLQEVAKEACAETAFAPDFFEITPAQDDGTGRRRDRESGRIVKLPQKYGRPPVFGPDVGGKHDFWMGDTIGVRAHDGQIEFEGSGRVAKAQLTEDADGAVLVELQEVAPTIDATTVT